MPILPFPQLPRGASGTPVPGAPFFLASLAALLAASGGGCAGPEHGIIAELRGRTRFIREREDEAFESGLPSRETISRVPLFPLLLHESRTSERGGDARFLEVLWPLLEVGRSGGGSSIRVRPILALDRFRSGSRAVIFPFYFRIRERRESGDVSIDHLWPLYGIHLESIDLAPAVTHHFLYPLIQVRNGWGRWKVAVFPLFDASSGYLDRGGWLLPIIKMGGAGRSRFFTILDPLFAYDRQSIAPAAGEETPEEVRVRWSVLGGLLGWEEEMGRRRWRWRVMWVGVGGSGVGNQESRIEK